MKKRLSVFFIFLAITFLMSSLFIGVRYKVFAESCLPIEICSEEAILIDATSREIIYSHNEKEKRPIASMCKIMTLLLCFEEIDKGNMSLDENVFVSQNASDMGGSQVFLEANKNYKVSELIKSIVVASANDASVAMAERISGSEENFVNKMNEKSIQLGMSDTFFVNCTGLPKDGQYSCALDVAKMFAELLKHNDYFSFSSIWMDKIEHNDGKFTQISNTNKLIKFYAGCDSGKTGYTSEAGHCLAASALKNDIRLICVVIKSPNSKTRFKEVSSLFNYGFANYVNKLVVDSKNPLQETFVVEMGDKKTVQLKPKDDFFVLSKINENRAFELILEKNDKIIAPINIGDELGELAIYENNIKIASVKIVANENIDKKTYSNSFDEIISNWYM